MRALLREPIPFADGGSRHLRAFANAVRSVDGTEVDIVHDPFHVVALASEAIDETHRDLVRTLNGPERKVVKGSRFLLRKGLESLKPESLERRMLLMEANEPLDQASLLKEDLRQFWSLPDAAAGSAFLDHWTAEARATGIAHVARLAKTLDAHRPGLLAYFRHRISTGPLEGLNNKVLKRQAYGFRDRGYFTLRLDFLHETPLTRTGSHRRHSGTAIAAPPHARGASFTLPGRREPPTRRSASTGSAGRHLPDRGFPTG